MPNHIRITGTKGDLAIDDDFSLDFEDVNPLFNDNVSSGSYDISVPLNKNRHRFKNIDDIHSTLRASDFEHEPMQITIDGIPFRSGELVVTEDQQINENFSASINSFVRSLDDLISDLNCQDIDISDDEIQIGECVGDVTPDYHFSVRVHIYTQSGKFHDEHEFIKQPNSSNPEGIFSSESDGGSVQLPAVGFTLPVEYQEANSGHINVAVDGNGNKIILHDYINTNEPYPSAKYCNAKVCYAHKKMGDDGTTSDQIDEKNPYFVLDAKRSASGICFYVLYMIKKLFAQLGLSYSETNLLQVEDLKRLAFYTTHCKYDLVRKYDLRDNQGNTIYDLNTIEDINNWYAQRSEGFKLGKILTAEPTDEKDINRITFEVSRGFYSGTIVTTQVGEYLNGYDYDMPGTVESIKAIPQSFSGTTRANIMRMYANSKNFPDASVSSIINSLWASFGIKFIFDYEQQKVTPIFIRDVFRNAEAPRKLHGKVLSITPVTEKITGVRMRYAAESDPKDQSKNVRDGVRDYNTAYDYLMTGSKKIDSTKNYEAIMETKSVMNTTCYVDKSTGNAYRWKVDGEAKEMNDLNAALFEVASYKGIDVGDCSKQNEDFIIELTSDLEPVIFTDVNFKNVKNGTVAAKSNLMAYADADMSNENEHCKITYALGTSLVDFPMTVQITTDENYDPSSTEDGESPLQSYDWGNSVAVMRGGGSDAEIQYYDFNYDGQGNSKYRTVSGDYAMTSDSMDNYGIGYDYNGVSEGDGGGERFALKITAYKHDEQGNPLTDDQGNILCADDERDINGNITRKIRSRGLYDSFMSEYVHFLLHRKKFAIRMICEIAELADIPNHWGSRYQIGNLVGWVNKIKTHVTAIAGLEEVEIEFFCL